MALIVAFLPDAEMRARLQCALRVDEAVRARHAILAADGWGEVERLMESRAPNLVVFDPCAAGDGGLSRCVELARRFPSVAFLPYCAGADSHPRDMIQLAAAGVRDVLLRDRDDRPVALYRVLVRSFSSSAGSRVMEELGPWVPEPLDAWMRALLAAAVVPLAPEDAARLYRRHANTLREHLRAAGFPPINKTIVWARLFQAAHLLDDPGRSAENVALALEFPSSAALRNQFQRYVGMSPVEVRAAGGVRAVARAFREAVGASPPFLDTKAA